MSDDLSASVKELEPWYHTFELPGGVVTPGFYDLRGIPEKLPLPPSLRGRRCLDAAASDGFWSFELARRGADEVVSVDLPDPDRQDWQGDPPDERRRLGAGMANRHFELVRDALGAGNTTRVDSNLYDLDPELVGTFDYVFVGNVLIHLADPPRALRALGALMRPGAELLSLESNSLVLTLISPRVAIGSLWDVDEQPRWWTPNRAAHRRLLHASGFEVLAQGGPLFQRFGELVPRWPERPPWRPRHLFYWLVVRRFGVGSGWVRARPRQGPGNA